MRKLRLEEVKGSVKPRRLEPRPLDSAILGRPFIGSLGRRGIFHLQILSNHRLLFKEEVSGERSAR